MPKRENTYLILGDYSSKEQRQEDKTIKSFADSVGEFLLKEKRIKKVEKEYSSNSMTSKKLLEMIEEGVYDKDKDNIVKEIKNSKYISITLGINDVIKDIKYDLLNDEFIYNMDVLESKIDIFNHNYYKIIEEIKDINKDAKVILVGVCNGYDDIVFERINDSIKDVAAYSENIYVETSDIKDEYLYLDNKLYLNNKGQEILANKVILMIKETY